jgi:trigger factor
MSDVQGGPDGAAEETTVDESEQDSGTVEGQEADGEQEEQDNLPAYDVKLEDAGVLRKRLTITVPRERIDSKLDENFGELRKSAQVPGFRTGRAPQKLIEKRFGSEVTEEVRNNLVGEALNSAVDQHSLKILGEPELDLDSISLPDEGGMEFEAQVDVEPEFDLPELSAIPLKRRDVKITDDDVSAQIDRIRASEGSFEPVENEPAAINDQVVADVKIDADGESIFEREGASLAVRGQVIEGIPVESLGDALEGKNIGETVTVEADIPEDYEIEGARGKKAKIAIEIRELKRLRLLEINEEFLARFGFDTEEELRNSSRENLGREISNRIERDLRDQLRQYLLDNSQLDLPEKLTVRQAQRALDRRLLDLQSWGLPEEEIGRRMDELQTSTREEATKDLKLFFIFKRIAEENEFTASIEEIRGRVAQIANQYGRRPERMFHEMQQDGRLNLVAFQICEERVMEKLISDASIENESPSDSEAEAEPANDEDDSIDDAT